MSPLRHRAITVQAASIGIATGAYALSFGAISVASGLSPLQTQVLSLLMFTGASQFALVGVLGAGGGVIAAVLTAWLLGARNGLYALSLAPLLRGRWWRAPAAAQFTIDESTAMALAHPEPPAASRHAFWSTGLAIYVLWNLGTLVGAGGGFMLVHLAAAKKTVAIDYREMAGALTTSDVFLDENGRFQPSKSQASGLGVGVPGTVAGFALAHEKYGSGKFSFADLIAPAVALARETAFQIAEHLDVPVFLYEAAAAAPHRRRLDQVRAGGLAALAERMRRDDWKPDAGPSAPHPTAGVFVIGARPILVAFNVDLDSTDMDATAHIARQVAAQVTTNQVTIRAFLFTARTFQGIQGINLPPMEARAYATMREINRFTQDMDKDYPYPMAYTAAEVRDPECRIEDSLFDHVYYVDGHAVQNSWIGIDPKQAHFPMVAEAVLSLIDAATGDGNVQYTGTVRRMVYEPRNTPVASAVGAFTFALPVEAWRRAYEVRLAREVLDALVPVDKDTTRLSRLARDRRGTDGQQGKSEALPFLEKPEVERDVVVDGDSRKVVLRATGFAGEIAFVAKVYDVAVPPVDQVADRFPETARVGFGAFEWEAERSSGMPAPLVEIGRAHV